MENSCHIIYVSLKNTQMCIFRTIILTFSTNERKMKKENSENISKMETYLMLFTFFWPTRNSHFPTSLFFNNYSSCELKQKKYNLEYFSEIETWKRLCYFICTKPENFIFRLFIFTTFSILRRKGKSSIWKIFRKCKLGNHFILSLFYTSLEFLRTCPFRLFIFSTFDTHEK